MEQLKGTNRKPAGLGRFGQKGCLFDTLFVSERAQCAIKTEGSFNKSWTSGSI